MIASSNRVTSFGERAEVVIRDFSDMNMGSRLMSMGILPGSQITIERVAPMKGGYCLKTASGQKLALRYQEADNIIVE